MRSEGRVLTNVSVGLLLTAGGDRLVLVCNRDPSTEEELGWGLPAGGTENQVPMRMVLDELLEETAIKRGDVCLPYVEAKCRPHVVPVFSKDGDGLSTLGLVYEAEYCGSGLSPEGWEVEGDSKVVLARPFLTSELCELIDGKKKWGDIYRREINEPQILRWLVERANEKFFGRRVKRLEEWLGGKIEVIAGLRMDKHAVMARIGPWRYVPPYEELMMVRRERSGQGK